MPIDVSPVKYSDSDSCANGHYQYCCRTQSLMLPEMAALIKSQLPDIKIIAKESTDTLSMEIKALRMENAKLCADNAKLREDVDKLTNRVDKAETENDALEHTPAGTMFGYQEYLN